MDESWVDIEGFEGLYQVSNLGRVKSLERFIERKDGRKNLYKSKTLKPSLNLKGYEIVNLSKKSSQNMSFVHKLVARAFINNPNGFPQVNHLDGNKLNNSTGNLEWVTGSQNVQHAYDTGLLVPAIGANRPNASIDDIKGLAIITMANSGFGYRKIARTGFCSAGVAQQLIRKKSWRHLSYLLN